MLRWVLPAGLVLSEYLAISFLVDLPVSGPAMRFVAAIRIAIPVAIGAAAGAWLLQRRPARVGSREVGVSLPPWRPWPALAANLGAFAATALLAKHLLGAGAPPVTTAALLGLLTFAAVAGLLALASAAPLRWMARLGVVRWRVPLIAVALGLASWRAAVATEGLWGILSGATLRVVGWTLGRFASGVTVDPTTNLIGLSEFRVFVAPVCSGADGLGLVLLFQAIWISMSRSRLRLSRAVVLLPLGAVAALAANVLRLTALILVGASGRVELAAGGLHSKLGWILFIAIALASVAIAERTPWLRRPEAAASDEEAGLPPAAAAYLAPLMAALATALITSIWRGPLDLWYGARVAAALGALLLVRRDLPRLSFSAPWIPLALAAGVCAIWIPGGGDGSGLAAHLASLSPPARWTWIATRVVGSCLVIPLAEELAFRGFLLPWLASADFEKAPPRWNWLAVVLSSVAFGAIHQRWLVGTVAGLAFAVARLHRGRLGDALLAHAASNAGIAAAVLLGGRWDLWG